MPDVTISLSGDQAARVTPVLRAKYEAKENSEKEQAARKGNPYTPPTDGARTKRFLIESLKGVVLDYERGIAEKQTRVGLNQDF